MDALFLLFGLIGLTIIVLIALAIPSPAVLERVPHLTVAMNRGGQGLVAGLSLLILSRAGQFPAILRHSLALRHQIATDEAKRATLEAAPKPGEVRSMFSTSPGFGKVTKLADLDRDR